MCFDSKFMRSSSYLHLGVILLFFLFIYSVFPFFQAKPNNPLLAKNTAENRTVKPSISGLFIPGIGIIKKGQATNFGGGPGCDEIQFIYEVTNESANGEILTNVAVTDVDLGGLILAGPISGDDGDNLLEIGETWVYTATSWTNH